MKEKEAVNYGLEECGTLGEAMRSGEAVMSYASS